MTPFRFARGSTPLLISLPHVGTHLPDAIAERMTDAGRAVPDTDWHVDRLYGFARALGANLLIATYSRYVIDLNRAPDGKALYAGASNTELCPLSTFADQPIYRPGHEPGEAEVAERRQTYWQPYHDTIASVLDRLKRTYGVAMLWDAHSIASRVPRFFDGRLTDLNLGTADGASADPALAAELLRVAERSGRYSAVLNGRFKGGYITRNYGRPAEGVHAIQLELSCATYMDEAPPWSWRDDLAGPLQQDALQPMIETVLRFAQERARG